jgi:hypothetical protein
MKKFLISGLVLSLVLAFTGCDNGTTTPEEETRVVDPRYRGEFLESPNAEKTLKIVVTETDIFITANAISRDIDITLNKNYLKHSSVYTVVNEDGSAAIYSIDGIQPFMSFKDENTIKYGNMNEIYTRRVD